jgi:hypothetical protein
MRYPIDKAMVIRKQLPDVGVLFKGGRVYFKGKSGTLDLSTHEVNKEDTPRLIRRIRGKCLR